METIISIKNLVKHYYVGNQTVRALRGVSIDIKKGEYVAIMGPSGSGKSTLMNILGALDTPTEGDYLLNGTNVSHLEDEQLAEIRNKEIGFVFQTFNLLQRYTALENVTLPLIYAGVTKVERQKQAKKVLSNVGLEDRITHKPNELSGGQRQRVAVARALVNNPSTILADEPTANLDAASTANLLDIMAKLNKEEGITCTV